MIKLGELVKDKITGFTGIATSMTQWLNGCVRVGITPRELREGKPIESVVFDQEQIEVVGDGLNIPARQTGGDRVSVVRATDPQR
jgi:hypothetical protein